MLVYCYTRDNLGPIKTPYATPFSLRRVTEEVVPPEKIYVTSRHYLGYILEALGDRQEKLIQLNRVQREQLSSRTDFPIDFKNRGFESLDKLRYFVSRRSKGNAQLNFAVMNGIGNGLGDNLMGFASLQYLVKLLEPHQARFHLLQELSYRTAFLYQYEPNVLLRHSILALDEFLGMDFVIDLSDSSNLPSFDEVPTVVYNAHAFSIQKLVPHNELQAKLGVNERKVSAFAAWIKDRFANDKPVVLLHPKASTLLRTMPPRVAGALTRALIKQGFNVVSAFPHESAPGGFVNISELSRNIDDLLHIVAAVDAVVSVGTVVVHMAASLNKATLLLPTAMPDVRSAEYMSSVIAYIPEQAAAHVQDKHKAEDKESIQIAEQFWNAIEPGALAQALSTHMKLHSGATT